MVVSMDGSLRHQDTVGHEVDRHGSDRYEHYSAEHESEEQEGNGAPPDLDAATPLASGSHANSEDASVQDEHRLSSLTMSNHVHYEDKNHMRAASTRHAGPNSTSTSLEGYFSAQHNRSPSTRRAFGPHISSTQSSSGSLHALSEHEGMGATQLPLRRALSTRSNVSQGRLRSTSHSKINVLSSTETKRPLHCDQLTYPDQSLASLQSQVNNVRPHPVLRTRSSHPAQNLLFSETAKINRSSANSGIRTADNTPMSSPGLFSPSSVRHATLSDSRLHGSQLHHLQAPKETHTAEIDHDVFSGNKFINNYEVIGELGRGEHGKVKLGRDMERNSTLVAIKIVPRYSMKRRLGKLGAPEDRTKREVAILKKARHPNVVSLLEVIDDPNKNKVYLILEHVDKGEIKWRKHGVKEVLAINNQRFEKEKLGVKLDIEPSDRDAHIVHLAHVRHDRLEQMRRQHQGLTHIPNWSLEYAGETDDENDMMEMCRSMSRQYSHISSPIRGNSQDEYNSPLSEPPLSGSMYGSYMPDAYRNRKFSIAASAVSHMSSEMNFEQDDDQRSFVPALTLEEALRAFRDTLLGLEFLHFIGIIHRDIKPANLLMSSTGAVKISDFGVSYLGRPVTEEEVHNKVLESEATPLDNEKELARSVGTPAFWAPELCYDSLDMFADKKEPKITGALDLWALGITLYCMIYARLPFYHNETMGLHEAVCSVDVVCPKTRLVPVDTTSAEPVSRPTHPINSNKRLDYELKFEHVPDTLRDLITKLLIKDPARRITIAEAKKHPWVTEGMPNPEEFLQNPEIAQESKKKIMEMSDKEIDRAVIKRNFIEKISNTAGRIVGSLLGRKDTRKRASTTASSAGSSSESLHSPAGSSTSTVGKSEKIREARRASLRGDELLQALKASRDPNEHHPLAQSQTASPDSKGSPDQPSSSSGYFDTAMKAASTGATPVADVDRQSRPRGPDRAASALSTAESVKTIRPSHRQRSLGPGSALSIDASHNEQSLRSRVEGLWEGTTKTFTRLASRDRRHTSTRSRSQSQSRPSSENDGHAGPSLAVSNTYAAGAFQTPNALKAADPKVDRGASISSPVQDDMPRHSVFRAPSSDHTEFEHAQQMNQRRQIQEALAKADAVATEQSESNMDSCPPSPDDLTFTIPSAPQSTQISPSEVMAGAIPTAISASSIASSIDGYGNSSVSQSISNPSIGLISGSSSPPGENFLPSDYKSPVDDFTAHGPATEPEFMRTADTVTFHGRPATPTAMGKPLQAEQEYFEDGDDEDDSSDEEEGIVMGGLRKT